MIGQARIAYPAIIMNGQDFYSALAPYLIGVEYTDNCDGERADDLTIELADRDKRFINEWAPAKGAYFDVSIITERWFSPISPKLPLDCGRFWIDTIEFHMPDNRVTVKACSLPSTAHLKVTDYSQGWKGSTLEKIAEEIAHDNQMEVSWVAKLKPEIEEIAMDDENALQFLQKEIKKAKLTMKIHRGVIVVFDDEELEALPAKFTVLYGNGPTETGVPVYYMAGGQIQTRLIDTAKKARLVITDPNTMETVDTEYGEPTQPGASESPSKPSTGAPDLPSPNQSQLQASTRAVDPPILIPPNEGNPSATENTITVADIPGFEPVIHLNEQLVMEKVPDDFDKPTVPPLPHRTWDTSAGNWEGELLAKAALRERNKRRFTGEIELAMGNPLIAAGQTFNLVGLGQYDGKWFVVSASHVVGPAFSTTLTIRRCLVGY